MRVAIATNTNDILIFERLFLSAFAMAARVADMWDMTPGVSASYAFGAAPHINEWRQPSGSCSGKHQWLEHDLTYVSRRGFPDAGAM